MNSWYHLLRTSSTTAWPPFFNLRVALPSPLMTASSSLSVSPSKTGRTEAPPPLLRGAMASECVYVCVCVCVCVCDKISHCSFL